MVKLGSWSISNLNLLGQNSKKDQSWHYDPNAPTTTTTHQQLFNVNIKVQGPSPIPVSNGKTQEGP